MRRAVIYLRVSTIEQTTANQERELREIAGRMGCEIVKVYKDHGISGAKGRNGRPAFDALCRAAARREFGVLMAWSVDRLGRSLQDLVGFLSSTSREIDAAFATFLRERPDALFAGSDPFFGSRRIQLVHLASRHMVPTIYSGRQWAEAGGLISYGSDNADAWRQAGAYAGRILKGAKPADLPVVQSTKFELVINHQTARMLGLTVPDKLLAAPTR